MLAVKWRLREICQLSLHFWTVIFDSNTTVPTNDMQWDKVHSMYKVLEEFWKLIHTSSNFTLQLTSKT